MSLLLLVVCHFVFHASDSMPLCLSYFWEYVIVSSGSMSLYLSLFLVVCHYCVSPTSGIDLNVKCELEYGDDFSDFGSADDEDVFGPKD